MIPSKIDIFERYVAKKTTLKYGYYYQTLVTLPFGKQKKRMVRVWLPEDYEFDNPNKRYPVIYFSDGQNLVDKYLTAFGEWKLDKVMHKLMKKGLKGLIAVGIDCPKDPQERTEELCPPFEVSDYIKKENGGDLISYADKYVDYIVNDLKPIIDKLFFTLTDKENTGIGGSSMGGLMSYYAYIFKPNVFGYSLSFSPAFFFFTKEMWKKINDKYHVSPKTNGKLFLYVGGKDFESMFVDGTCSMYQYLVSKGFKNDQVRLVVDTNEIHSESAWTKYLHLALLYWLKR